jgi:hypothetical protein
MNAMRLSRLFYGLLFLAGLARCAWADRVIMKDGKVYDGHMMGETEWNLLISNPLDAHPRFIPKRDVMTIVRQDHTPPPASEPQRYLSLGAILGGDFFTSRALDLSPAAVIGGEAGFRLFPSFELGADFDWTPNASGDLGITDGTRLRTYDDFWMYRGGFWTRVFPFASRHWLIEPYLFGGFQWDRLLPKGTDDYLKGTTWRLGVGCQRVLYRSLYGDLRLLYHRTRFDAFQYLDLSGDLSSAIANDGVTLSIGLSYHLD